MNAKHTKRGPILRRPRTNKIYSLNDFVHVLVRRGHLLVFPIVYEKEEKKEEKKKEKERKKMNQITEIL